VITDATAHDGRQLGRLLDPRNTASPVWADVAYRSAANVSLLARRGLAPQFQRPKPRGNARRDDPRQMVRFWTGAWAQPSSNDRKRRRR
jgi:hypothetical protein